jgi:hypothetical protein
MFGMATVLQMQPARSEVKEKKLATKKKRDLIGTLENLFALAKKESRIHQSDLVAPVLDCYCTPLSWAGLKPTQYQNVPPPL